MNHDEVIGYDLAGMGDYGHTLASIGAELEGVTHQVRSLMAGVAEYFTTHHATPVYNEVVAMLMQGIEEGKETLHVQGQTVIQAGEHFSSTDSGAANTFMSI